MALSREQLKAKKRKLKEVALPDGDVALVSAMSQADYGDITKFANEHAGKEDPETAFKWQRMLCARCLVDDAGNRLYQNDEEQEIGTLPRDFVEAIAEAAQDVNGLVASAVEDAKKNLPTTSSESSPSA